jgi:hypothetical protein
MYLTGRTLVHAALLDSTDAVRAAETCRDLGWDSPIDAYDAARFRSRCIPVVAKHAKPNDEERQAAVRFYGDEALKMLRAADGKGYKDASHMTKYPDFDPLRGREDFQKLLAGLERKGK